MVSVRAFVVAVGALLIVAGGVGLVLDQLKVFQSCTATPVLYGSGETCDHSPALLVVAVAVMIVGLVVVIGGVIVKGADD